jgi:hypothetical protein
MLISSVDELVKNYDEERKNDYDGCDVGVRPYLVVVFLG